MLCLRQARVSLEQRLLPFYLGTSLFSSRPYGGEEADAKLREWLQSFSPSSLTKDICDVSFSRSSGPGGQNVNKINSKTTLTVPVTDFKTPSKALHVPSEVMSKLKQHSKYLRSDGTMTVQADTSRRQSENIDECFSRLYKDIRECVSRDMPGETSVGQQKKVHRLQKAANETRLRHKKLTSARKSSRKWSGGE